MISVPNHQLQLNGSKFLGWLALIFLFQSCSLFQKVPETPRKPSGPIGNTNETKPARKYDPVTDTYVIVTEVPSKVDTIRFNSSGEPPLAKDNGSIKPNTSTQPTPSDTKNTTGRYKIAYVLPFLANRLDSASRVSTQSEWAIQFYLGSQMAMDQLAAEGLQATFTSLDSEGSIEKTKSLIRGNKDLKEADLIIGPYKRENVKEMADFAKANSKIVVSPYSAVSGMTSDNPYFVQVNPSLTSHYEAILAHVLKGYTPDQIVLVGLSSAADMERISYYQNHVKIATRNPNAAPLRTFIVDESKKSNTFVNIAPELSSDKPTILIVVSTEEPFVFSLMRNTNLVKGSKMVMVYGMPQWYYFKNIDFGLWEQINPRMTFGGYTDFNDPSVRKFRRDFYDRYQAIPSDEAYLGYDVSLFFGRRLKDKGTQFLGQLDVIQERGLYHHFSFQKEYYNKHQFQEGMRMDCYENKAVQVKAFRDYHFQEVQP